MTILRSGSKNFLENEHTLNVNWSLTRKCNYTCSYCTVYDNQRGMFPPMEHLTIAVEKIAALDREHIDLTLSGGEPTLHPQYADLIHLICGRIPRIRKLLTITNLSRTPHYFDTLCQRVEQWTHKLQFKASYHFEHAVADHYIANAEVLGRHNVATKLSIMAHPERMEEVKALYERLKTLSVKYRAIKCDATVIREDYGDTPDKRYSTADLEWLRTSGDESERVIYLDEAVKIDGKSDVVRTFHRPSELVVAGKNRFKNFLCNAGINMLVINAEGVVRRAVCLHRQPYPTTNIYQSNEKLSISSQPLVCPFEACGCLADLAIPKAHPQIPPTRRYGEAGKRIMRSMNFSV